MAVKKKNLDFSQDSSEMESEDDAAKYGYNIYNDDERDSPWSPQTQSRLGKDPFHPRRMPRRSSLKGGSDTPRQFRRNSLNFSGDVSVTTITPALELANKKSLWFDDEEYAKIEDKIYMIAERAQEGGGGRKHCTRGLEKIIHLGTETRRCAAWDAVLLEQESQIQSGAKFFDDAALSRAYQEACKESRSEATSRGMQDARAVSKYLSETRFYCRRMSM